MQVQSSTEINAPASATWQILGEEFADISRWLDAVLSSSLDGDLGVGVTRTCNFAKNLEIKEQITVLDRRSHRLTYDVTSGLPSFMGSVSNAWVIEGIGNNRSRATSTVTANLAWYMVPLSPLLGMSLRKTLRGALAQLTKAAEDSDRSVVNLAG